MATDNKIAVVTDDFLLEDIEDLPGFVTPPTGAYRIRLDKGIEDKEINDNPYFSVELTILEVMEVVEENLEKAEDGTPEALPKEGDIATLLFAKDNQFGMGNFKSFVKSIAEKFGLRKVGEIREVAKGLEMCVVIKRKWNKKAERFNINVTSAQVL